MPQREGEVDYKYEDYASEMATHRLPQTSALVNQPITAWGSADVRRARLCPLFAEYPSEYRDRPPVCHR